MSDEKFLADNMVEVTKNLSNAIDNYMSVYMLALQNPVIRMTANQEDFYKMTSKKMSNAQLTEHINSIRKYMKFSL